MKPLSNDELVALLRSIAEKPAGEPRRFEVPPPQVTLDEAVIEYVLGLDALGLGLGRQAHDIQKATLQAIRPLEIRRVAVLERAIFLGRSAVGPGLDEEQAAKLDIEGVEITARIEEAWGRCLESLKLLYLSSGAGVEAFQ